MCSKLSQWSRAFFKLQSQIIFGCSDGVSEEPTGASVSACVMLPGARGLDWCSVKEMGELGCRVVSLGLKVGFLNIINPTKL